MDIDLNDIEQFVNDPNFHAYLLANTTDFGTAAFVLQTLLDKVDELRRLQADNA